MDGVEDLALGYRLAAADYPAVSGVLLNESLALVVAHVSETDGLRSVGLEVVFLLGAHSLCKHIGDILGYCGRGGEAGGFDAGDVDEFVVLLARLNDEIVSVAVRSEAREGGDDLSRGEAGDGFLGRDKDLGKCTRGGGNVGLIFDVKCARADEQVAVDRRGDEDALAHLGGALEYRVLCERAYRLVAEHIFALSGGGMYRIVADERRYLVAEYAGGVDDILCGQLLFTV